jgi:hypothetical protein
VIATTTCYTCGLDGGAHRGGCPCPSAAPAPECGQTDAKDATGRIDAIDVAYTVGGAPVVILDSAGPVWLVTASSHWVRRAFWLVGGDVAYLSAACRRVGFTHVELEPRSDIDPAMTGEVPL